MGKPAANQIDTDTGNRSRLQRFHVRRDAGGRGISADIELDAVDAKDAETRAAELFSHERVLAKYEVTAVRAAATADRG
jgi:hypothetical protein